MAGASSDADMLRGDIRAVVDAVKDTGAEQSGACACGRDALGLGALSSTHLAEDLDIKSAAA